MFYCTKCPRKFTTHWGVHAHTRCHQVSVMKETLQDVEEVIDWDNFADQYGDSGNDEPIVEFENVYENLQEECIQYLRTQQDTLSTEMVRLLEAGYPKLLDKTRKVQANIVVYFEIANFVNNLFALSGAEADSLIAMMKKVTHMFGNEIPLPV